MAPHQKAMQNKNQAGKHDKSIIIECVLQAPLVIHTPHALPMFKEAKQIRKRKSERDHDDAVKFHKPEVGSSAATLGRGAAGLIGKTGGTLLTQYILKNHVSCARSAECCVAKFSFGHYWQLVVVYDRVCTQEPYG